MMPNESTVAVPGADCARIATLLPLSTQTILDETRLAIVQAHVTDCAHCQHELALHVRLDEALRRVARDKAEAAGVLFSREELLRMRDDLEGMAASGGRSSVRERPARRTHGGLFIGIPAVAAVLLLALFAGFVFHLGGGRTGIVVAPVKHGPLPANIDLYSISMVSATEGWAVGGTVPDPNYSPEQDGTPKPNYRDPVLAHYHDGVWTIEALPAAVQHLSRIGLSIVLNSVSMISSDEGWAGGGSVLPQGSGWQVDGVTVGVLLHYVHGTWIFAAGGTSDTPVFSQMRMRSATDGWAVAGAIYHYDGSAWRQVKDSVLNWKNIYVGTLALAPDGGIWAEGVDYSDTGGSGFDGDAANIFLRFDGSHWMRVASPLPSARISSITMTSASDGWAVGVLPPPSKGAGSANAIVPFQALILRYHDGTWKEQVRYPGPVDATGRTFYTFSGVLATADGQGWAVGSNGLLAHYTHGAWERLPSVGSAPLHDVSFLTPSEGWAAGERGTVLHFANGVWKLYGA